MSIGREGVLKITCHNVPARFLGRDHDLAATRFRQDASMQYLYPTCEGFYLGGSLKLPSMLAFGPSNETQQSSDRTTHSSANIQEPSQPHPSIPSLQLYFCLKYCPMLGCFLAKGTLLRFQPSLLF